MKSPARPPLRPRNNRDMTVKEPSFAVKQEKDRRRQIRIQQARARANEAARVVRQRTERAKIRLYSKIASEELQKYRESKIQELIKLETEYQNALNDMGLGHEGLEEQAKYEQWKIEQAKRNREIAIVRGEHALNKVSHQNAIKSKLEQEKSNLKKCVKMVEDARAAKVRSKLRGTDPNSFVATGHVIEVDLSPSAHRYKQVRFQDQENVGLVRPIHTQDNRPGIEEAIKEENEKKSQYFEQRKMARMRGLAALKRAKMTRQAITESFFEEPVDVVSTSIEPTTLDVVDGNESSKESSDSSSLHANVIRLDPREADVIDHATAPYHDHHSSEKSNHQFVLGEAQALMTKTAPRRQQSKDDEDFVAKVLEGFQPLFADDVAVELRVEEVSTLQSSSSTSSSSHHRLTCESTSSMDLSEERFLNMPSTDIHGLINVMRENKTQNGQLRSYIEKLLSLKREEIANLSVTDSSIELTTTSSSLGSGHSGSGFVSSTPASILSSDSSKSSLPKSVRFQVDAKDGSYVSHEDDEDDERRKQQIMEQTKISLKKIQVYYDEQRRRIEAELTRRRLSKQTNTSPLSEGPLLSSSSSNEPPLSSSAEEPKKSTKKSFRQMTLLNKSSSSGTTTTGSSVATAELLQRLQLMEMPSLQRPHQSMARPMDELNTSADLIPDLDTASSYHQGSSSST